MKRFYEVVAALLLREGLLGAVLVHEEEFSGFGDSLVILKLEPFLLSFERERGREFLSLGSIQTPDKLHYFEDVAVAMGWSQISEVLESSMPEPLQEILGLIHSRWDSLVEFFHRGGAEMANERIEKVAAERGRRMIDQLNQGLLR